MAGEHGITEPRLWTKPLRPLTRETSLGFEVIDFAEQILGIRLYPWQQWLLIHALELLDDGQTYRFRRVIVLVGRQNGKTLLVQVLCAWWLWVDSQRHPDRVPPLRFKIVGTAQNLDIAREPWNAVKLCHLFIYSKKAETRRPCSAQLGTGTLGDERFAAVCVHVSKRPPKGQELWF